MKPFLLPVSRATIAATHDLLMAAASFVLALYLRLWDNFFLYTQHYLFPATLIFTGICGIVFSSFGLYRGLWRYASVRDLIMIGKATTLSVLLFLPAMFLATRLEGMPRSVPIITWLLLLVSLGGPRFLYRVLKDRRQGLSFNLREETRIPVLLLGINDRSELFLRDTGRNSESPYRVAGIVEDDRQRIGRHLHGIKIYGPRQELAAIIHKLARKGTRPQRIVLTDDQLEGGEVAALLEETETLGIPLARLPRSTALKAGRLDHKEIEPVALEDLLGRPQNIHDRDTMQRFIAGRRVLITGAGGSIGGELARQVAALGPSQLVLLELSEYQLYQIDMELGSAYPALRRQAVLCDVRDTAHLDVVLATYKPEVVFHAAAIKHVPLAEENPEETVLTNIRGTCLVAEACVRHRAASMVMISTDKAVNPTSLMGATKRMAERYCRALGENRAARGATRFVTVRFGNVLGSTGSVVPLFQRQLAAGGPITVTHPEMTRFFMTIREAVELVIQAGALGSSMEEGKEHGLIFVLDMGQPVKITALATQIIRLAGLRPGEDIAITYTGLRPGEKLYEELFYAEEQQLATPHKSILLASAREMGLEPLRASLAALFDTAARRERTATIALLRRLLPEYAPPELPAPDKSAQA